MPRRARVSADIARKFAPSKAISPDVAGRSPMMHLSSVVLPMPLRPMRHVRDRFGTTRGASHSVWLPPYDWFSPLTVSTGSGSEVHVDDPRIGLHCLHVA